MDLVKRIFGLTAVMLCISVLPSFGVIYVDTNVVGSANTGVDWANAYQDLALALTNAPASSEIWVAKGTYTNTVPFAITSNGVTVYGGFTNNSPWADRDWTNNHTVIDGKSAIRCLAVAANDVSVDGLIFYKGRDQMVTVTSNRFTIRNCKLMNSAVGGSSIDDNKYGVLNLAGTNNLVDNCYFATNIISRFNGYGTIYCATGNTVVLNSSFVTNRTSSSGGGSGPGIYYNGHGATLTVSNCLFRGNKADSYGGGVYIGRGMLNALDCNFVSNYAGVRGGAIMFDSGDTRDSMVRNCAFAANNGTQYGGAISHARASTAYTVTVENCSFYTNYVPSGSTPGGAIFMNTIPLKVRNCIFWKNDAVSANGKEISSSGAVEYAYSSFTGTNNTYIYTSGTTTESNNIIANPQFAGVADLHLKSTVGRWDPAVTNWAAPDSIDSPCIDLGDTSYSYANEPAPNGSRINMGAYGNTIYASKSVVIAAPSAADSTNSVYYTAAIVRGKMTAGKTGFLTIYYGDNDGGTDPSGWDHSYTEVVSENQEVGVTLIKLNPLTTYYYRTYVTNSAGSDWSDGASSPSFLTENTPPSGPANIVHVNIGATNAFYNDGSSWPFACLTVQVGLDKLNNATNELWIVKGGYTYGSAMFLLASNTMIYGGFTGSETSRDQRNVTNNIVIIDGNSTYRCLNVKANDVLIDGVVFNKGRDQMITVSSNRFTMSNCKVMNSVTGGAGIDDTKYGILNLSGSNNLVDNCLFGTNRAARNNGYGGAIYAAGNTIVKNCSFITNYNGSGGGGGGLYLSKSGAVFTVSNCFFRGNVASAVGGGIYIDQGTLNLYGCDFASNVAYNGGGAVYYAANNNLTNSTIKNCAFILNMSTNYGGAIGHMSATSVISLLVENCSFYTNCLSVLTNGGAIYMQRSSLLVKNSILWSDTVPSGVGMEIYSVSGDVTVTYSCLTETNDTYVYVPVGVKTISNSMVMNPLFAGTSDLHLQSMHGRWNPSITNWVYDSIDSPCIDAGDPASSYSNEPEYNGGRINMGAYGNTIQASKSPGGTVILIE